MKPSNFVKTAAILLTCALAACSTVETQGTQVTVFEGARLITGEGSAPIENSAFIVENTRFTRVGRRGELPAPAGAVDWSIRNSINYAETGVLTALTMADDLMKIVRASDW